LIDRIIKPFFRDLVEPILNTSYDIEGDAGRASNAFRRLMHEKFELSFEEAYVNRKITWPGGRFHSLNMDYTKSR
jgi:hypothetical protein